MAFNSMFQEGQVLSAELTHLKNSPTTRSTERKQNVQHSHLDVTTSYTRSHSGEERRLVSSRLSVCPRGIARLPMDRFPLYLILGTFV